MYDKNEGLRRLVVVDCFYVLSHTYLYGQSLKWLDSGQSKLFSSLFKLFKPSIKSLSTKKIQN